MQTVLKALIGSLLAFGFTALETHAAASEPLATAKPTVAFLGLGEDADPLFHKELTLRIRRDLAGDTAVRSLSTEEIAPAFARGILKGPEAGALDLARLGILGAQFYAFAWLEPEAMEIKRKWTKPWDVKVRWSQGLRLRVIDAGTGAPVYDGRVPAAIDEKGFVLAPDLPDSRTSPVDRDRCQRRMLPVLSAECAKAVADIVTGKMKGQPQAAPPASAGPSSSK
jgi:hypothetical protein